MTRSKPLSVCVYCGAKTGTNPNLAKAARAFGQALAQANMRLVYGAGSVGIMGEIANAVQTHGGEVFGVIPEHLVQWEVGKADISHFIVTETMHERKKVMAMNADAFVLLPGGFGSLDEFFEILTWRQLERHSKPAYILNIDGYWDGLLSMIDGLMDQGFVGVENRGYFTVCDSVDALMDALG